MRGTLRAVGLNELLGVVLSLQLVAAVAGALW